MALNDMDMTSLQQSTIKVMKRNNRIWAAAVLFAAVASSCGKEEDHQVAGTGFTSFFAVTEPASDTRVYADGRLCVLWNADDRISVFNKNTGNQEYRFDGNDGDDSGTFSLIDASAPSPDGDLPFVYAVYPYSGENLIDDEGVLAVEIPHRQPYREGTFAPECMVMVSATEDQYLRFRNVCGILSLKLFGEGTVTGITLRGNNGEHLSGEAAVTIAPEGLPETQLDGNVYDTIELQCGGVSLSNDPGRYKEFWFIAPPTTFTRGFTATITLDDGVLVKSTEKSVTISRSTITRMAAFDATFVDDGFVVFDDPAFKAYCLQKYDGDGDGEISYREAEDVISIDVNSKEITSLKGVEHFKNLYKLYCYSEGSEKGALESVDLSGNPELEILNLSNNRLSELNVSNNPKLVWIQCGGNSLRSLDVSRNTKLTLLRCPDNELTSLDLSQNLSLSALYCWNNRLGSLDISANTELEDLYCADNQLTSLDLKQNTLLSDLNCRGNQITSLDLSGTTSLEYLICDQNELTSLTLGRNTKLKKLDCSFNQIPSLDVSGFTDLWLLECSHNRLASLDVSTNVALTTLDCRDNALMELDLRNNCALYELNCSENEISSLDVSGHNDLTILVCFSNRLASLDVSGLEKLGSLQCWENEITTLNVDGCVGLRTLQCSHNLLSSLDISSNVKLLELNGAYNQLTSIDLSHNPELTFVNLDTNCLSSLDVSCRRNLDYLDCSGNCLSSIDVSQNTVLRNFYCMGNQLTTLDVSKNPDLEALGITSNRISSIDTGNNPKLALFYCEDNLLTTLDVSSNTSLIELFCDCNPYLSEIWLKAGQTIPYFLFDSDVSTVYYK